MIHTTEDFLKQLFRKDKIFFRALQENEKGDYGNHERYGEYDKAFVEYNNKECGIFFMVNSSPLQSTKDKDIKKFNAVFMDFDDCSLPDYFPIKPSAIISRDDGQGHHVYFFLTPTDEVDDWKKAQQLVINFYNSDPAIKNPARIMRLPGTVNRKPKRNAQKYEIVELNRCRYELSDIFAAHTDKKKIIKTVEKQASTYLADPAFDKTERGAVHEFMIKIVMRMHGLAFSMEDTFDFLMKINKTKLDSIFTKEDIRRRLDASKYAKNKKGTELKEEIEKELARQNRVKEMLIDWYYVQQGNYFVNVNEPRVDRTKDGFNAEFSEIAGLANVASYAFLHRLIKQAEQLDFEPAQPRILPGFLKYINLNLWVDERVKPEKGDASWFVDHLAYLIPNEKDRGHFMDWLAYAVQNPGAKIYHAILIIGKQSIGKSMLNKLYRNLFGESNVNEPHNENFSDRYTKWARNTCLCVINELKQVDKHQFYALIKPYITEDKIEIREMYKATYTIKNHMNIMAYSNLEVPVKLEKGDRRWFVIKAEATRKADDEYYTTLKHNCENNAGVVAQFLLDRDVSAFNVGMLPPITEAKTFILDDSRPELERWIEEGIENYTHPFKPDLICIKDIMLDLPEQARFNRMVTNKYVAKLVRGLGGIPFDKVIRVRTEIADYTKSDGKRMEVDIKQLVVIRNHDQYKEFLNYRDVVGAYELMQKNLVKADDIQEQQGADVTNYLEDMNLGFGVVKEGSAF